MESLLRLMIREAESDLSEGSVAFVEYVREKLRQLPDRYRFVLERRLFDGWTLQQCADELGITRQAVCMLEKRASERISNKPKDVGWWQNRCSKCKQPGHNARSCHRYKRGTEAS